jgi:hypothetical protein
MCSASDGRIVLGLLCRTVHREREGLQPGSYLGFLDSTCPECAPIQYLNTT